VRVTLLAHFEGAQSWPAGSERDLDDAEALRLIQAGYAVPVSAVEVETTARKPAREKRG
jgi:hypothetical protein